jgi:hypothetical protein
VGGDSHFVFHQKLLVEEEGVRQGRRVVMVKQLRSVRTKVWGDVFTHFHAFATKLRSRTRNSQFGLLGPMLFATTTAV